MAKINTFVRRGLVTAMVLIVLCVFVQGKAYASEVAGTVENSVEAAELGVITRHEDSTSMPVPDYCSCLVVNAHSEDVALVNVPRTGDISVIWLILSGVSGAGILILNRKHWGEM